MTFKDQYDALIALAKARKIIWEPFKYEEHHIIPRCMGGGDTKDNLVLLTIREHFTAHILLAKSYPENGKLANACRRMLVGWQKNHLDVAAEDFEYARVEAAKYISTLHKGRKKSEQEIENIRAARLNAKPRVFSEEAKANMAAARRKTWEERRNNGTHLEIAKKMSSTRKANGTYAHSEERKKQIGEAQKGRIPWNKGLANHLSDATREKMSAAGKARTDRKVKKPNQ